MALASYVQSSFLGGSWSQSFQGRIDRPDYRTALNVCINGIPLEAGAWDRRSGTRFGAATRGGQPGRVVTYTFERENPYTLEFTDGYLRFFSGYALAYTNDTQAITVITTATPASLSTTTAHGWSTGNTVVLHDMDANHAALHNRQCIITVTSATSFTLADALTGVAINGSAFGVLTAGNVSRVLELATPYAAGIWSSVRSVQADTNAILLHGSVKPYILSVLTQPTETAYATFSLAALRFLDGPYLDPFTNGVQVTPSALTGIINLALGFPAYDATKAYDIGDYVTSASINYRSLVTANLAQTPATSPTKWVAVSAYEAIGPNGFVGSDIGRHIRLLSAPQLWTTTATYVAGNVVEFNGTYWTALGAIAAGDTPGTKAASWGTNAGGAIWTWGKITGLLNQISQGTGSSIGNMTGGGGLAAAFDGILAQTHLAAAATSVSGSRGGTAGPVTVSGSGYVGKNYTASPQKISFATLYPSSDYGFAMGIINSGSGSADTSQVTVNLRAKATLPTSASDGTLLGTSGAFANSTNAVTINSSDTTTSWNYVWFEILSSTVITAVPQAFGNNITYTVWHAAAEVQNFSASTGTGNGVTVQILGPNLLYTLPVRTWRLGLYNDATGWPTCGTYHEGRLWLSGSVKNRLDASQPIDTNRPGVINMAPTEANASVTAASAISYTLRSPDTNTILWLEPDQQGIIVGTEAGEWLVQSATNDGPITALSIKARRVTKIGCANVLPVKAENTTVFVQRFKQKTIEYFSDVYSGKFTAPNLAVSARHLTARGLEELAYQKELAPIIWARCTDGSLIGTTYKRESLISSQGPTFAGWHEHELGSERLVTSIANAPSPGGLLDSLAIVTSESDGTGPYHVEFLADLWQETDDASINSWFLDNAVAPTLTRNATVSSVACLQCFGMFHLAGEEVQVTVGGLDVGDYTVTAEGIVNVPYTTAASVVADGLFTAAYVTALGSTMSVVVGFTYTSDGQMVRPALQQESGARSGPGFGKMRRSHMITPLLVTTQGISFGTLFDKLNPALFETPGGTRYDQNELFTGIYEKQLTDDPSRDGMICWRITRPYPAMISAMGVMLQTTDQ